jgi:hypothetical protein
MIKLLTTFTLLFITLNLFSQDANKDSYGISFGSGQTGIYTLGKTEGGPGHDGISTFEAGLNYYHPLNQNLYFESGLYWHYNKIKTTPNFYPGVDLTPRYSNCNIFYVPLNLKLMFLKYFFIDGGMLLNLDVSTHSNISNQTAIGADFGFGIEIPVLKHYSITLNPYVNIHELYKLDRHDLMESIIGDGVRLTIKMNKTHFKSVPHN